MRGELERIADTKESLNRYCKSHEDAPAHSDITEGMDKEREEDCEDAAASIKGSASIVDPTADNEDGVVAGQGKQELVEAVLELGAQEDNQGEDVTNDANEAKDGDKNSIKVISIVEDDGHGVVSLV